MGCCCGHCSSGYTYTGPSADEVERAEKRLRRIEEALGIPAPPPPKPAKPLSEVLKEYYAKAYDASLFETERKAKKR